MKRFRRIPLAALVAAMTGGTANAATFLVGGDTCDFATIQPAIDAAAASPGFDTIRVATNTTYAAQALRMDAQDVEIVGGFASCASTAPAPGAKTTISGTGGAADSVLVILGNGERLLRKLVISGGDETNAGTGGGIDFEGAGELILQDVVVAQNRAGFGGGISFVASGGTAAMTFESDVVVQNNVAAGSGGGVRLAGSSVLAMNGANTTVTANEALGLATDSGYGGGVHVAAPALLQVGSSGFGNIGAIAFNRAKFGGGIAITTRSDVFGTGFALMFTRDPQRPVRVNGNVASIAGGGAWFDMNVSAFTRHFTGICAHEFRIDGNRAPDGAALFFESDNDEIGAFAALNAAGCGFTGLPTALGAQRCAARVPCNLIDGNVVQQANGQPATGPVLRMKAGANVVARRVAFVGNAGNDLILSVPGVEPVIDVSMSDCLVADNTLGARVIAAARASISNCTIAGNAIALSTLSITTRAEIRDSISWQPGFATLAPFPTELVGNMVLSNDALGVPGGTGVAPRFVDPARGDYHLRAGSPAVDYAPPIVGDDRDLEDLPRDQDLPVVVDLFGTRDLGAFERPALMPLELNGTFDADLNLWDEVTAGITRFDPTENATGLGTGGSLEVDYVNSPVVLGRVTGRRQCVHLPGPGTYRLNGFARTIGGGPLGNPQSARLQWEFRRDGTEACTSGPADRSGDHVITSGSSFVQPAFATVIEVANGEWTPDSSITIGTVVQATGVTPPPRLHAWFDGIRLIVDTIPPFEFSNGFE